MSNDRDFSAQDTATIRKWEREIERGKARADASEANFTKTFADTLKQENAKKALARAAREAVDQQERGQSNPAVDRVKGSGSDSIFGDGQSTVVYGANGDVDPSITGKEPRPWEDR